MVFSCTCEASFPGPFSRLVSFFRTLFAQYSTVLSIRAPELLFSRLAQEILTLIRVLLKGKRSLERNVEEAEASKQSCCSPLFYLQHKSKSFAAAQNSFFNPLGYTYSQASFFFFAAPKLKFFFYTLFFFLSNQKLF